MDYRNLTLLHRAAEYAQVDCVKVLISLGADVNINPKDCIDNERGTPLNTAVDKDHFVASKLLLKAGAKTSLKFNGFPAILLVKSLDVAKLLVEYGADVSATIGNESLTPMCRGDNALHALLDANSPSPLLKFFFDKVDVNAKNQVGETPLHKAVSHIYETEKDLISRINALMAAGANPLIKCNQGRIPFVLAQLLDDKNGFRLGPVDICSIAPATPTFCGLSAESMDPADKPRDVGPETKCQQTLKVIKQITKEYIRINNSSRLIAQGLRSPHCLFSRLPAEVLTKIVLDTTQSDYLDEKSQTSIARKALSQP